MRRGLLVFAVALLALGGTAQAMPAKTAKQALSGAWDLTIPGGVAGYFTYVKADLTTCDRHPNGYRCSLRVRWRPLRTHKWQGDCKVTEIAWRTGYRFNRRDIAACRFPTTSPSTRSRRLVRVPAVTREGR